MSRTIIPIILVVAAIALFVVYTNPAYQATKSIQTEVAAYNDALNKSQQLRTIRDQKVAAYNTFSADDTARLEEILPDNVDNIHLIIDINSIAARHGLSLKNVDLGTVSNGATAASAGAVGSSGSAIGSISLGFTVSASYDDFLAFLQDLEHSLRVIDVEKISFSPATTGLTDYNFTIQTYWLH
jgi:Tfp pilus assembly protein PilO